MTDIPDKSTIPPDTEPMSAAEPMSDTKSMPPDPALTMPLETGDAPTARFDDDLTLPLSPLDAGAAPASAAFTQARWAAARQGAGAPAPPPNDVMPVRLPSADPGGAGTSGGTGATPAPPRQVVPTLGPPVGPVGTGAPAAPTRPPPARGAAPAPRRGRPRRRPRFTTILWGVLLLGFAAFMVARTVLPAPPDPTFWLLGGVILVGLLLVVAGLAAASRRAG